MLALLFALALAAEPALSEEAQLQLQCILLRNEYANDACVTVSFSTSCSLSYNLTCADVRACGKAIEAMGNPCLYEAPGSTAQTCRLALLPGCTRTSGAAPLATALAVVGAALLAALLQ